MDKAIGNLTTPLDHLKEEIMVCIHMQYCNKLITQSVSMCIVSSIPCVYFVLTH